jgi:hypothetical protein
MHLIYQKLTACVAVVSIRLVAVFDFTYIHHQVFNAENDELF